MHADKTLLAAPITHLHRPIGRQAAEARSAGADLVELRVDLIGDVDAVEAFLREPHDYPIILTIRRSDEGGAWDADESDRVALFERLGLLNPGFIDIEQRAWAASANLRQKIGLVCERLHGGEAPRGTTRSRNRLILSIHDFQSAARLDEYWRILRDSPAHVVKLAVTPQDAKQSVSILRLLAGNAGRRAVVAIGMGAAGECTRILGSKFGAFLAYAPAHEDAASAPGQVTLRQLVDEFRWRELRSETPVFGLVGWPVAHSKSPRYHNAWMSRAGIDGVYVRFPVSPTAEDFAGFMDAIAAFSELCVSGLSVTLPHKEHALRWLQRGGAAVSELARRAGAVNTLVRIDDRWVGENTDCGGAIEAILAAAPGGLRGVAVAVLGAGGVARAVCAGLLDAGARVCVYNRSADRARALVEALSSEIRSAEARIESASWADREEFSGSIVINCTSLGMWPDIDDSPMPFAALRPGRLVFDTVYNPVETRLLRDARVQGCQTLSGLAMFERQAAAQFRLWHGVLPAG